MEPKSIGYTYATQSTAQESKPATESEDKGSVLGWFACSFLVGNNFTSGANYNWDNGQCTPRGHLVSRLWRGR